MAPPPSFRPRPQPERSTLTKVLIVLACVAGGAALLLVVGVGLLFATCAGLK
jgi:hypothetical protein